MSTEVDIRPALRALLESQRFAALATDDHGQPFVSSPACAIVGVTVSSYQLVSRFQQVVEWCISA